MLRNLSIYCLDDLFIIWSELQFEVLVRFLLSFPGSCATVLRAISRLTIGSTESDDHMECNLLICGLSLQDSTFTHCP